VTPLEVIGLVLGGAIVALLTIAVILLAKALSVGAHLICQLEEQKERDEELLASVVEAEERVIN